MFGDWKIDVPSDAMPRHKRIAGSPVLSSKKPTRSKPAANTNRPTAVGRSQPMRSDTAPEIGPAIAFASGMTQKMSPATSGAKPRASCR